MHKLLLISATLLFASACGKPEPTEKLTVSGSNSIAPMIAEMAEIFESRTEGLEFKIQTGSSSRGIADTSSGKADIGMTCRPLAPDEAGMVSHTIAIGGIAVILHGENNVKSLTKEQLVSIFTGRTANWNVLGGPDHKIVVVSKGQGNETLELFTKYLGIDHSNISSNLILDGNEQTIAAVAENRDSIAFVALSAAESEVEKGTPVQLVKINGIEATTAAVANRTYPISCPLLLVTKGEPTGHVKDFIEFTMSGEAHSFVVGRMLIPIGQ